MKNKLRKIVIDEKNYLYAVKYDYHLERFDIRVTLSVYLDGFKNTPLKLFFFIRSHFSGIPLKLGVLLDKPNEQRQIEINLNKPSVIRKLIEQGIRHGWDGKSHFPNQDGLAYLEQLGYDVSPLLPKYQSTIVAKNKLLYLIVE